MNSRERVTRTLQQKEVDRIPRQCWSLPSIWMFRRDEYMQMNSEFPSDIGGPDFSYGKSSYVSGKQYEVGKYTDEWGCEFSVGEPGIVGEVKSPLMADWEALKSYRIPWELLNEADFSRVDKSCEYSELFIIAGTQVRPFERMQFLRGTENLLMDIADEDANFFVLRDMLHEFFKKEMSLWGDTKVDGVSFMDDWGNQKTLMISPDSWRRIFKPLYKEYCDLLHSKGKFVFFHSDGNIESIYPDLIEIGIDAVNSQLFCMDIEKLGEKYAGKITFWGEIDRQFILPFGTVQEVRAAVDRVANALIKGKKTGVIAQCEWGSHDPLENIEAVFDEWLKI
ncbi:MAG: uroporphyrinogen decarboxylase family protein [Saccharofermentanales bacterium]